MKKESIPFSVIVLLLFTIFAAVNVGLTLFTLNSSDICFDQPHSYVYILGVLSAIQLTFFLIFITFSCCVSVEITKLFNDVVLVSLLLFLDFLHFAWMFWGMVILISGSWCLGTLYYDMIIIFTILSFLACIITSLTLFSIII